MRQTSIGFEIHFEKIVYSVPPFLALLGLVPNGKLGSHMESLEADSNVKKWTKNHGIRIPYYDEDGAFHTFTPDFLVEMADGTVEIHEVKGTQFLGNPITRKKFEAGEKFWYATPKTGQLLSPFS